MDLVSIILPYYKKKIYIKDTINSILDQTYQNFEIIIIDDELSDESIKVLNESPNDKRSYKVSFEKINKNLKNLGAGYSRNEGIKISKGEFLAFCDCDDLWNKNKIDFQLKFMKRKNIDASHTSYCVIDENGMIISNRTAAPMLKFNDLLKSCDIGLSSDVIKKNLLDNLNLFFPNIKTKEDYVLWLRLSQKGIIFFGIDEILVKWRRTKNSLSSSLIQKLLDGYKVYRIFLNLSFLNLYLDYLYCL